MQLLQLVQIMFCLRLTHPQAIQVVDEFVS